MNIFVEKMEIDWYDDVKEHFDVEMERPEIIRNYEYCSGPFSDVCQNRVFYFWRRICHDLLDRGFLCGKEAMDHS